MGCHVAPYLQNKVFDWSLRGQSLPSLGATHYVGLFTTLPSAPSAAGGVEVSATGYSRKATTFPTDTWSVLKLLRYSDFTDAAQAAWGTIVGWGVWTAQTGGELLFFGDFSQGPITPNVTQGTPFGLVHQINRKAAVSDSSDLKCAAFRGDQAWLNLSSFISTIWRGLVNPGDWSKASNWFLAPIDPASGNPIIPGGASYPPSVPTYASGLDVWSSTDDPQGVGVSSGTSGIIYNLKPVYLHGNSYPNVSSSYGTIFNVAVMSAVYIGPTLYYVTLARFRVTQGMTIGSDVTRSYYWAPGTIALEFGATE